MKRLLPILLLGAFCIIHASAQLPQLKFPELKFNPPKTDKVKLSNGIEVFLLEDHEVPIVDGYALVRTGSIYDPSDKLGLAEVTGELLRTGGTISKTPEELNEALEFIAASVESNISEESGRVSMSVLSKDADTGLQLMADVIQRPRFDDKQLELIKKQFIEALIRRNDEPGEIVSREYLIALYGKDHPLARFPKESQVASITVADVRGFYEKFYAPANILVGFAGDFKKEQLIVRLESLFGKWVARPAALPQVATASGEYTAGIFYVPKNVSQTNIRIGHFGTRISNPDFFALSVMDTILGSGFSSRLTQTVRTQMGLAYHVGSSFQGGMRDLGAFTVSAETAAPSTARTVKTIISELQRLKTGKIDPSELQRAKDEEINSFVFSFDSPRQIVIRQMQYRYFGLPEDFLYQYRDRVAAVTIADVERVAQKYLHPDKLIILAVGPPDVQKQLEELGKVSVLELK
ncbi:MAG TPA: pitrilysin family protein [Acidobacteriota bacterium]